MHNRVDRRTFVAGLALTGASAPWAQESGPFAAGLQRGALSFDHVWTPGRTAQDAVTRTSVQSLPLRTWVKVAGTQFDVLSAALAAAGWHESRKDWSNSKSIRATFVAWGGCARHGLRIYYPRGGGHGDSSVNGTWMFDAASMRWSILDMPSDPDAPGMAWDRRYKVPPNGDYTRYVGGLPSDDGLYPDILPDGRPTSAHVYCGVWYDSRRHRIGTGCVSKWSLDLASRRWLRERWTWDGGAPTAFSIHQQIFYHAGRDALYGFPGRTEWDSYSFGKCSAAHSNWEPRKAAPDWSKVGISSCRLDSDRVLFLWFHRDKDRWGIYDMAKEEWEPGSGDPVGNGDAHASRTEMKPAMLVPAWGEKGQVIRRSTGEARKEAWWVFDLATKSNQPYERQGARASAYTPYPGNKWLCIEEAGLCLMLDEQGPTSQPAVMVMRYR